MYTAGQPLPSEIASVADHLGFSIATSYYSLLASWYEGLTVRPQRDQKLHASVANQDSEARTGLCHEQPRGELSHLAACHHHDLFLGNLGTAGQ